MSDDTAEAFACVVGVFAGILEERGIASRQLLASTFEAVSQQTQTDGARLILRTLAESMRDPERPQLRLVKPDEPDTH